MLLNKRHNYENKPPTDWKKIFTKHNLTKDWDPGSIKNCYNSIMKNKQDNQKIGKIFDNFTKESSQMANKHIKKKAWDTSTRPLEWLKWKRLKTSNVGKDGEQL